MRWRGLWRDEVGERKTRLAIGLLDLLAKEVEGRRRLRACGVGVNLDVIAHPVCRKETVGRAGAEQFFSDDFLQKLLRIGEQLARFFAVPLVAQDCRIPTA